MNQILKFFDDKPVYGWKLTRILMSLAAIATWIPRSFHFTDNYSSAGIVITSGPIHLTKWVIWSPVTAWILYGMIILGAFLLLHDKWFKSGAVLCFIGCYCLLGVEGLNMKAYDRLFMWQNFILLFAPSGASGSPLAKYMTLALYCNLYASTGWMKWLYEEGWHNESALTMALMDLNFGNTVFGVWLTNFPGVVMFMSLATVFFECFFFILIFIRAANPFILLLGFMFHLGTFLMLHVGAFFFVAVASYPVMLHPEFHNRIRKLILRKTGTK